MNENKANAIISIFSLANDSYLSFTLDTISNTFNTFNLLNVFDISNEFIPILNEIEKLKILFPEKEIIYLSLVRNNTFSIVSISTDKYLTSIGKNIFKNFFENFEGNLNEKKTDLKEYFESLLNLSQENGIVSLLQEMQQELVKYSSFICVFDSDDDGKILGSTIQNKDMLELAKEVFNELKRLTKFDEFEIEIKKLGTVQCFYFNYNNKVFVIYSINVQVNAGIIRLKLKTWIKNNREKFSEIENNSHTPKGIHLEKVTLNPTIKFIQLEANFYNY